MNYINSFKIFGEEVKQNPCIILNEAPTEVTIGLVGMIAMDVSSEKKDLYKCVSVENEIYTWELISSDTGAGGTSTQVVTELPEVGDENIDYILNQSGTYLYYKWIDGAWHLIAGSKAEIVETLPEKGDSFTDYYLFVSENTYTHYRWINDSFAIIGKDTYSKTEIDNKITLLDTKITTNAENIEALSDVIEGLQSDFNEIDKSPRLTYDIDYNNPDIGENTFVFYEIENEGKEDEVKEVKKQFTITGGTGGTGSILKIEYVETSRPPLIVTTGDKTIIEYYFSGKDSSNDDIAEGIATWKIGGSTIGTQTAIGSTDTDKVINSFDVTDYLSIGTQKVVLSIQDDAGNIVTKTWSVQKIDMRIESTFDDAVAYPIGDISFSYTPYGAISKEIYFVLDGVEIGKITSASSGIPATFKIPSQTHGAHLLEVYMKAIISGKTIESNHIKKDIIVFDSTSTIPIIGCSTPTIKTAQYNTVNIKYVVFDPNTETPEVTWSINGEVVLTEILREKDENGYYTYSYKANNFGTYNFTISCGNAVPKTIIMEVEKLDITIEPVTENLALDFNPADNSNKLWSPDNTVTMTVSDNFDWVNGGYQIDEQGDQYFCVKAGTSAIINYNLFSDDPKEFGKEFKVIFKTQNIRKRDTSFLTCIDNSIGLDMKVEQALVYNSEGALKTNYCEDTIIEYEFNINKKSNMMIIMSYEDGTPNIPYEYTETSVFRQTTPQPITIGSLDCDILVYRIKAYSRALTDIEIKNNFIADARNADEMIARYTRNQIYSENGELIATTANGDFNVDALMKAAPDLRYIFLEVPQFTNDKDNKIDNCTVYFKYPNGTRPQDNWTCTGMRHRGQGTSSNLYGYAGRNIDLCMDRDTSVFTWIDEEGETVESSTITLSDTSVPTDYLNIKVNIASSENANNAEMARRFNKYQPFLRYARKKDNKVKDTMEFYNCIVFIRETSEDVSVPHREFKDTNWHFYAIGNVGDSKKTDDTRVNDKNDPKEHVIEIMDADVDLARFPTGKEDDAICPKEEWTEGNTAYDILYSTDYVYDKEGEFESFGNESYEFRYEMDGITAEQREVNINAWRDLYKFIVTSTDEEFYSGLKDYFVVDSALYYYLFTERYTMVDNRAKNSFWHYGKVYISETEAATLGETEASYYIIDNDAASINNGYRYDLTFGYDFDTCLGIDNTGDFVFPYGKEDTDYYVDGDPASGYVFRVADSVFFCRLRDLFPSEMQAMFKDREDNNAWDSNSLIEQWDNSQMLFPEELWRLDYERKYYRTYLGLSIDNSINEGEGRGVDKTFLIGKFFGRKKYARRSFEINQENYFATKYFGGKVLSDVFWIRGNTYVGDNPELKQNYSLTLTPYSDMYICVKYGSTGTPQHSIGEDGKSIRIKAGQEYKIINNSESMDFIYVYAASWIQEVGDLSLCYVGDNNFSAAKRLQKLVIGSTIDGYKNTFMKEILVANNPLLEYLDITNVSGINTVIDVSSCNNLKELYATGTNATGIIFANGGKIEKFYASSVSSLIAKNLLHLTDFSLENYENLQTLIVENTHLLSSPEFLNKTEQLQSIRIIGVNWSENDKITDTTLLNRFLLLRGINSNGYDTENSVLTGYVYIDGDLRESEKIKYTEKWGSELVIEYKNLIPQWTVTYKNYDDTVLYSVPTDAGTYAIEPISKLNYTTPEKPSDEQYIYSFGYWTDGTNIVSADESNVLVTKDTELTAIYTGTLQRYDIKWYSEGVKLYEVLGAEYGTSVSFDYDQVEFEKAQFAQNLITGYYTAKIFSGWDKNTGFITRDTEGSNEIIVNAIWQESSSNTLPDKTEEMTPTDIYLISKMNPNRFEIGDQIELTLGHDYNFKNVESTELIKANDSKYFSYTPGEGTDPIDTGIKLFSEGNGSFTLALDFEYFSFEKSGTSLMYINDGTNNPLLSLTDLGDNRFGIRWLGEFYVLNTGKCREMVVLKYIKEKQGSEQNKKLYIYTSSASTRGNNLLYNEEYVYHVMTADQEPPIIDSSLILGGAKTTAGVYTNGAGILHWCKIWYNVLEEENLINLARWSRQKLIMDYCGSNKYHLPGSQETCKLSFICNTVLGKKQIVMRPSADNINAGGWPETLLEDFYNNRLFKALPYCWRNTLNLVEIISTVGQGSYNITTVNNYIYEPSYSEYYYASDAQKAPYNQEGTLIENYNEGEIKERVKFLYPKLNGQYSTFKSLYEPTGQGTVVKDGDLWLRYNDSGTYIANVLMWISQENIDKYSLTFSSSFSSTPIQGEGGVWIWPETWWLRSPYYSQTESQRNTHFKVAYYSSTQAQINSSSYAFLCPCFSI